MRPPWTTKKDLRTELALTEDAQRKAESWAIEAGLKNEALQYEVAIREESVLRKNLGEAINLLIDYQRTLHRLCSPDPNIARANALTERWGVKSERVKDSFTILYRAEDGNVYDITYPTTNADAEKRRVTDRATVDQVIENLTDEARKKIDEEEKVIW
jgi:hypothetical protein